MIPPPSAPTSADSVAPSHNFLLFSGQTRVIIPTAAKGICHLNVKAHVVLGHLAVMTQGRGSEENHFAFPKQFLCP